jgi:hypothetical protein
MRAKWDERRGDSTYGAQTINDAFKKQAEHYDNRRFEFPHEPSRKSPAASWPDPLADEAFYGLPGEIVQGVMPYSEADPASLLAHVLAGCGAVVGLDPYAIASDAEHPAKLNTVIVGETSRGRKGSAARPIERILRAADASFGERITEGLSSGEGLIWQVRDPITKVIYDKKEHRSEEVVVDPGIDDRRLWIIETEFASVLRQVQREGNTLSQIVRRFWDRADVASLTKNSPAKTTGAHVAITGHVTKDELLRYLDRTELASGFANRFLWFCSRRAQLLPDGERVPDEVIAPLTAKLGRAIEWASIAPRVLRRDAEA